MSLIDDLFTLVDPWLNAMHYRLDLLSDSFAGKHILPISLLALVAFFLSYIFRPNAPNKQLRQEQLETLSGVVVPKGSTWPIDRDYLYKSDHRQVRLDLTQLVASICTGQYELRNIADLGRLLQGSMTIKDWKVTMDVDSSWTVKVSKWQIQDQLSVFARNDHNSGLEPSILDIDPPLPSNIPSPNSLCLDFIPSTLVESSISAFLPAVSPDISYTISLTTLSSGTEVAVTGSGKASVLCAVPFLPRRHTASENTRRTSSLMVLSLPHIITILHSQGGINISSITNVSEEYSASLVGLHDRLLDDRELRKLFIKRHGVDGWREHRLMLAWEAALLEAMMIVRWTITLERR